MTKKHLIAIDVDGVLNSFARNEGHVDPQLNDDLLGRFRDLCEWVRDDLGEVDVRSVSPFPQDRLSKRLADFGVELLADKKIPAFKDRGPTVQQWAEEGGYDGFVLIDDEQDDLSHEKAIPHNFVFVDGRVGLQVRDVAIALVALEGSDPQGVVMACLRSGRDRYLRRVEELVAGISDYESQMREWRQGFASSCEDLVATLSPIAKDVGIDHAEIDALKAHVDLLKSTVPTP